MSGPPSTSPTLPTIGGIIDGKYVLETLLGQGGMGAVYKARHIKLGHKVAIKVMLADAANHEAASRFVNEGRAAANIQNEHVVRVSDVDEEHGYAYMVLELLEGEDLAQVLDRERRLPAGLAVSYVLQALEGVRQAHAQGIVHRDLKPSNLFLARRQDGTTVIKVLDFGISKHGNANPLGQAPGALTSTKAMLGSPLYMSPEQLRSSKSVDARADIWAIGVILHELITGTLPFMGENLGELFAQILEIEAPPLRTRAPDAPQLLEAIVARCLQRRPEHRFQSVAELERELAPLVGSSTSAFAASAVVPDQPRTMMMQSPPLSQVHAAQASAAAAYGAGTPPQGHHGQFGGHSPPPGTYPGPHRFDPQQAPPGSVTGSGAHVPVVKGTTPLGAVTPQPNRSNDAAWQSTGSAPATRSPNTVPLVIAGLALLALVGLGLAGLSGYSKKKPDGGTTGSGDQPSASVATPPALSASVAMPTPSASAAPIATVDAGLAAVGTGSALVASASAAPPVVAGPRGQRPPLTPPIVVKVEPKPPDPVPPPFQPPPKKTGVQQNER